MKNYGESLAYWYFRLNGFIPMADFVLHRKTNQQASDCDLIAVRYPHVFEEIGGQPNDWDNGLLTRMGNDDTHFLATFVQVKTGRNSSPDELRKYFTRHVPDLVRRLGVWSEERAIQIGAELSTAARLPPYDGCVLSKVVVVTNSAARQPATEWIEIDLDDIVDFIRGRMQKYPREKFGDRMHFPDDLIQFFAEEVRPRPQHR